MHQMLLHDDNITIKPYTLEDASALFRLTEQNRVYLREWLPWLDVTKTEHATKKFIELSLIKLHHGIGMDCGIWHNGTLVGSIGFHDIQKANRKAAIGYWLDARHQGQGIMTNACTLMITYGFAELQLNRVEIKCAPGNSKSAAIPKRLGFYYEGRLREVEWLYDHFVDHDVYSMLAKDWKKGK